MTGNTQIDNTINKIALLKEDLRILIINSELPTIKKIDLLGNNNLGKDCNFTSYEEIIPNTFEKYGHKFVEPSEIWGIENNIKPSDMADYICDQIRDEHLWGKEDSKEAKDVFNKECSDFIEELFKYISENNVKEFITY